MTMKKVLLLYISESSGHHRASIAIENALRILDPDIQTLNINCFNYTNPILEKVINKTYMSVIKRKPEIWDYLYDNPRVLRRVRNLRTMIHRFNSGKMKSLIDDFKPDCVVCTQAFPCGMVADYKKSFGVDIPLVGVLTDYAPHSYWIYDNVDRYVVPSEETGNTLVNNGIDPGKIAPFGIPIDPKFARPVDREKVFNELSLNKEMTTVLIMGGTQGLGPVKELVRLIDRSQLELQTIIATGSNRRLYDLLVRRTKSFRKPTLIFPFAANVNELMGISAIIMTKPGGITTAEALATGIPMLIVNPLPGQESMNTKFLLREEVALKCENPHDAVIVLEELLCHPNKLRRMGLKAKGLSKPESAVNIAKLISEITKR
ncbi:MAG: glycosyltransferase [Candidatus Omnitrophica bacterium]|nr:glycosyltransferase [Candidatus Omnitrophota bacterium]